MEAEEFQKALILFLIYGIKDYENSFYLYRALERMFDIYDYSTVINDLIIDNFLERSIVNNVDHHNLTDKGVELLNSNEAIFIEELQKRYLPLQPEYIKNILAYTGKSNY
jgi:hypothetical protein